MYLSAGLLHSSEKACESSVLEPSIETRWSYLQVCSWSSLAITYLPSSTAMSFRMNCVIYCKVYASLYIYFQEIILWSTQWSHNWYWRRLTIYLCDVTADSSVVHSDTHSKMHLNNPELLNLPPGNQTVVFMVEATHQYAHHRWTWTRTHLFETMLAIIFCLYFSASKGPHYNWESPRDEKRE